MHILLITLYICLQAMDVLPSHPRNMTTCSAYRQWRWLIKCQWYACSPATAAKASWQPAKLPANASWNSGSLQDCLSVLAGNLQDCLPMLAGSLQDGLPILVGSLQDCLPVLAGSLQDCLLMLAGSLQDCLPMLAGSLPANSDGVLPVMFPGGRWHASDYCHSCAGKLFTSACSVTGVPLMV